VRSYLTERIPTIAQTGGEAVKWVSGFVGSIAFGFGGFLATLLLSFVVFVYANQSFDNYFRSFISLLPESRRDTIKCYLREIDKNLQQFLRGQVTVIAIISAISCIAYSIIGVPFALVVGLLAGICNAIPTFGPFIGGGFALLAMLMGLAAGDFGVIDFLVRSAVVVGIALGVQTIDNSLVSPKIMSDAVDVDPLLIMFGVIVGATVLGFWGVLLAIPIIVVIKSVIAVSQTLATNQHMDNAPAKANALEES
jgi:predicted PurR-regulated permease PerM